MSKLIDCNPTFFAFKSISELKVIKTYFSDSNSLVKPYAIFQLIDSQMFVFFSFPKFESVVRQSNAARFGQSIGLVGCVAIFNDNSMSPVPGDFFSDRFNILSKMVTQFCQQNYVAYLAGSKNFQRDFSGVVKDQQDIFMLEFNSLRSGIKVDPAKVAKYLANVPVTMSGQDVRFNDVEFSGKKVVAPPASENNIFTCNAISQGCVTLPKNRTQPIQSQNYELFGKGASFIPMSKDPAHRFWRVAVEEDVYPAKAKDASLKVKFQFGDISCFTLFGNVHDGTFSFFIRREVYPGHEGVGVKRCKCFTDSLSRVFNNFCFSKDARSGRCSIDEDCQDFFKTDTSINVEMNNKGTVLSIESRRNNTHSIY